MWVLASILNSLSFSNVFFLAESGALFENDTSYDENFQMLQYAVDEANVKILNGSEMELSIENQKIVYGREFTVSKCVCNLLQVIKKNTCVLLLN